MAALDGVLDARDGPLVPVPAGDLRESELLTTSLRVGEEINDDVALVVPTSGTTGTPKGAMLTPAALIASAAATHDRLGGPGSWLLALPTHHIAGIQVLVRSLQAGTVPVELDLTAGFDVTELPTAVAQLGSGRRYTALVATQLAKALLDPEATAALSELDAVLLGGGPAPRPVLEGAQAAGIAVVRTYGSSETAGGCVYDGVPLTGVRIRLDNGTEPGQGRIVIGGPTLAMGYRNPPDPNPFAEPGWFRTDDLGMVDESGTLRVLGRVDEAISTGGLTVMPAAVEAVLSRHPAVADCAVFGLPDDRLGERVVAAVVLITGAPEPVLDDIRAYLTQWLDSTAAPRELHFLDELPRRSIGKLDRRALRERFADGDDLPGGYGW
ncbi:o-succinylbenzoate--CoA ligase [Mycobacterium sp. CVI_P3]|uniref:O-succinylbenzoate--CoA ligase n=1 Tax=Mycobacterium pinniadriaticum TaxID=2994102 RepID=A0ABT3SJR6_9MYCO|nr:o-succinylbenzoate--CoA ligase [Mycobacterium pinniadriaticum]MCX2933190.1 o-succinylbenzoate--CoA ligase [Mycobacterium pinniadriaticum]MCX2939612.1 o-succinylbenzoate--CoA ligase [Mycobacterium pinniadriaticum]